MHLGVAAPGRLVLLLVLLRVPAAAATFLYLSSPSADEPVLEGRRVRLGDADAGLVGYPTDEGGLSVQVTDQAFERFIFLYFYPPTGQHFAPGPYDGVTDCGLTSKPGLCVGPGGGGVVPAAGHMDVREASYDASGHLVRFAVDFSQRSTGVVPTLYGSLRWHAGDGACQGAADGTPCDDVDACTTTSACANGSCVAADTVACGGSPGGACLDPPVCDPVPGTCAPPTHWPDGISCQSADRCAFSSYCVGGSCATSVQQTCIDGDPCTYDTCDTRTGCTYQPIPGVCGHPGLPGAFLFVRGSPPGPPGSPLPFFATADDGAADVGLPGDGSIVVSASVEGAGYWSLTFAPAAGETLVPGVYDDAAPYYGPGPLQRPLLYIGEGNPTCARPAARFVVHEFASRFVEGGRGQALAFSADFEQRCPDGWSITGAVRFGAGDPTCANAPDGTPCDDLNACSASSACSNGLCVGTDPVTCPEGGDGCHAAQICDPTSGTCIAGAPFYDGMACDASTTCVHGTCTAGVCTSTDPVCDDGDPCTADRCDGAGGCEHGRMPTCWRIASRTVLSAQASGSLQGHDVECGPTRCQLGGTGSLFVNADGTYRSPSDVGGQITCPASSTVTIPDEVGRLRPGSHHRLFLRPSNLHDIKRAIHACTGRRFTLNGERAWIAIATDGDHLTGMSRTALTLKDQLPIKETVVSRIVGTRTAEAPVLVLPPRPAICAGSERLTCHLR